MTTVSSDKLGIMFSEVMSGGFALNQTDPAAGAKAGKSQILTMHGSITIDDLDAFIADPSHLGRLDVRMDWVPFGTDLSSFGGVFNLFSPTDDRHLKLMVYEWGMNHQGQPYYFAGQKTVRTDPLFDVWKETTTLYTTLHQGSDKTGKIVGSGILELSPGELIKMTATFTALNSNSIADDVKAATGFGKFFLGELWHIYIKK